MTDAADPEEEAYRALAERARRLRVAVVIPCIALGLGGGVALYLAVRAFVFAHGLARFSWLAGILSGVAFVIPFLGMLAVARSLGRSLVRSRAARWAEEAATEFRVPRERLDAAAEVWRGE